MRLIAGTVNMTLRFLISAFATISLARTVLPQAVGHCRQIRFFPSLTDSRNTSRAFCWSALSIASLHTPARPLLKLHPLPQGCVGLSALVVQLARYHSVMQ